MNTNKLHQEFVVSENGLYISLSHGYLAATPDGISHCKCHGKAVIEVKCPFSYKDRTLEQAAIIDPNFCLYVDEDKQRLLLLMILSSELDNSNNKLGAQFARGSQLKRISYTCPRIDSGIPNQNQESLKMTPESESFKSKL